MTLSLDQARQMCLDAGLTIRHMRTLKLRPMDADALQVLINRSLKERPSRASCGGLKRKGMAAA